MNLLSIVNLFKTIIPILLALWSAYNGSQVSTKVTMMGAANVPTMDWVYTAMPAIGAIISWWASHKWAGSTMGIGADVLDLVNKIIAAVSAKWSTESMFNVAAAAIKLAADKLGTRFPKTMAWLLQGVDIIHEEMGPMVQIKADLVAKNKAA